MSFRPECEIKRPAEPIHFLGLSVFFSVIGIFSIFSNFVGFLVVFHLELDISIVSLVIDLVLIKSIQKVFNLHSLF